MRVYNQFEEANRKTSRYAFAAVFASAAVAAAAIYGPAVLTDIFYGDDAATARLTAGGYTATEQTGKTYKTPLYTPTLEGCADDALVRYEFEATTLNGKDVGRFVCVDFFGDSSVTARPSVR